ncbi:unnamed protein product [Musa acuminata subsp. malaccensis]|uniref:(wild Malaysian banana) hypothetical protein n=1 Tax=Musa acuminata subsp. malaccensis TaxID=214687 RepID=A0A804KHY1_MUSAM|nr:unnamed protein product [Musa acuminata subsp. malaccensis]
MPRLFVICLKPMTREEQYQMACTILVNIQGLTTMTAIMEVGCDVTHKEERISSKIARKEAKEQLRLIAEEEALQRWLRRMKKKLKHG